MLYLRQGSAWNRCARTSVVRTCTVTWSCWTSGGLAGCNSPAGPRGRSNLAVVVRRPSGPQFRASEVFRLGHLAGIAGTVLTAQVL